MKHEFLMIILTLLESGQMSAAFVNTASLEECERRAAAVRTILSNGDVPLKELICRRSDSVFEPFSHGTQSSNAHRYRISFDASSAWIEQLAADAPPCRDETTPERDPAKPNQYCAVSAQNLLSEGN